MRQKDKQIDRVTGMNETGIDMLEPDKQQTDRVKEMKQTGMHADIKTEIMNERNNQTGRHTIRPTDR